MHTLILGRKQWIISEPVFKDLKIILTCLNRLNNQDASDADVINSVQLILISLLGERHVKKFQRYCWEAWKIPAPSSDELTALFAAIPDICGLQTVSSQAPSANSGQGLNTASDWDSLYWRIIRQTGWTWETIDNTMTLSRLSALQENLAHSPAVESLVAAYLGYEYSIPDTLENKIDMWLASQGQANETC